MDANAINAYNPMGWSSNCGDPTLGPAFSLREFLAYGLYRSADIADPDWTEPSRVVPVGSEAVLKLRTAFIALVWQVADDANWRGLQFVKNHMEDYHVTVAGYGISYAIWSVININEHEVWFRMSVPCLRTGHSEVSCEIGLMMSELSAEKDVSKTIDEANKYLYPSEGFDDAV